MGLLKVSNKNKDTGADAGSNAGGSSNGGTPVSSSRKGGLSTPGRFSRMSMSKGSSSPPAEGKQQPESPGGASAGGASAPEIEIEPLVGKGAAGASRKTLHGAADAHHSHSHKSFNAPPSSPYAVALGLVKPDKMYKEIDNEIFLSGAMTDRTHGNARRPAANDPKAIAQSRGPKKVTEEKSTVVQDNPNAVLKNQGKYGFYAPVPNFELSVPPKPAARLDDLPRFSGSWKCVKTSGEWDIYLRLAGVDEMKIHLAKGTLYGKGISMQDIKMSRDKMTMTITNKSFETGWKKCIKYGTLTPEVFRLDGAPQSIASSEALGASSSGTCTIGWEGRALCTRFELGSENLPVLMKRYLKNNLMVVRFMCADFAATRIYGRVDAEGDLVDGPPRDGDDDETEATAAKVPDNAAAKPTGGAEANGKPDGKLDGKPNGTANVAKEYKSRKSTASQYAAS